MCTVKYLIYFVAISLLVVFANSSNSTDEFITLRNGLQLNTSNILKLEDKELYFMTVFTVTWHQAFEECTEFGGKSLSIYSEEENNLIQDYILKNGWSMGNGYRFWTSGTNLGDAKNRYVWFSTGEPIGYSNWNQGEPSGGSEHCLEVANRGSNTLTWNDEECLKSFYFICEK